jgi:predicted metal-dependent HD superfamily phosphohydrolase
MGKLNFERAKHYALERLEQELPPHLYYHGIAHTRDDVVPAVENLARLEGIHGTALSLLLTAAWFHDLGHVEQARHHELISARIAVQVLPDFGYTTKQVETVRWAILATALPQSPQNQLEQILTDADLDVLGRDDFMHANHALRCELAFLGEEFSDLEWYGRQLKFLEAHTYFTASARSLREEGQLKNIQMLKERIELLIHE